LKSRNAPEFILASGSPRRKDLLNLMGLKFKIKKPQVNEKQKKQENPIDFVKRTALEKASSIVNNKTKNKIILAADTIVVAPNKKRVLGKPRSKNEAISMIRALSGATHQVMTGYCIVFVDHTGKMKSYKRAVKTFVKFRKLNLREIKNYVDYGESMDKAGAYAAQGKAMEFIDGVRGSYTNVIGLPLSQLADDLKEKFNVVL